MVAVSRTKTFSVVKRITAVLVVSCTRNTAKYPVVACSRPNDTVLSRCPVQKTP